MHKMTFIRATALVISLLASLTVWAQTAAPSIADTLKKPAGENPYGIGALWGQGDLISKGTLIILLIMSAATWYVAVVKFLEQSKLLKQGAQVLVTESNTLNALAELPDTCVFKDLAQSGAKAIAQAKQNSHLNPESWVSGAVGEAIARITNHMQGGMSVLATVGSVAPFVGLFGTVWGIYHALTAIGIAGQASIDKVAGPVGEALIMTAIGLAVAVPAVLLYNWLLRRNKQVVEVAKLQGSRVYSELLMNNK